MSSAKTIIFLAILLLAACGADKEPKPVGKSKKNAITEQVTEPSKENIIAAHNSDSGVITADFSSGKVGAEPVSFVPAVGYWTVGVDGDNHVLFLDGSRWRRGQTSANIAEQAREIYGDRYSEFLDNIQAYAYFPFAIAKDVENFSNGEITLRFKNLGGRIDQNAGIMFDLKPNGDYYTLRGSSLENNLVLWRVLRGKRSSVEWVRNTPTPTKKWHDLKLVVDGRNIQGYLNGHLYLEFTLEKPVDGKVGVWSKADSEVYFDDFKVIPKLDN